MSTRSTLITLTLGLSLIASPAFAKPKKPAKKPAATQPAKGAKPAAPAITEENKKALLAMMGEYKFAMTKDEVTAVIQKGIDARYAEKLKETTDTMKQDRLRKDKKDELKRFTDTYTEFKGEKTGWDVSLIQDEFGHGYGESMMVLWENQDGKNQRRFFFFIDGHLYKMFISLDVSMLPEDKRNFAAFQAVMEGNFGPGAVDAGGAKIVWAPSDGSIEVTAIDKLRMNGALCLVIDDPKTNAKVLKLRAEHAAPKEQTSTVIKAVVDDGTSGPPDLNQNSDAVDAVIGGAGGKGSGDKPATPPKTPPKKPSSH